MPGAMRLLLSRVRAPRALERHAVRMASLAAERRGVARVQAVVVAARELLGLGLRLLVEGRRRRVPARDAGPRRRRHRHTRPRGREAGPPAARGADLAAVQVAGPLAQHGLLELGCLLAGAGHASLLQGGGRLALGLLRPLRVGPLAAPDLLAGVLLVFGPLLHLELAARLAEVVDARRRVEVRLGAQPREPAAVE